MKKVFITDYINNPEIEQKVLGDDAKVICLNKKNGEIFKFTSLVRKSWISFNGRRRLYS